MSSFFAGSLHLRVCFRENSATQAERLPRGNQVLCFALSRWYRGKEHAYKYRRYRRCGFGPWVGKIPWRRAWQSTPVFLPGESHGQRSWVHTHTSHMEEDVIFTFFFFLIKSYQTLEMHEFWPFYLFYITKILYIILYMYCVCVCVYL